MGELAADLNACSLRDLPVEEWGREEGVDDPLEEPDRMRSATQLANDKDQQHGPDTMRYVEKRCVLIQIVDLSLEGAPSTRSTICARGLACGLMGSAIR